jgi:hypothetical protein
MSATRPAPPLQTRLELLTLFCSVPQRDAAATRTARFSLSMNGLEVLSSISVANFIFTESVSAVQLSVPAHAIVFDISGYGQRRATARFICCRQRTYCLPRIRPCCCLHRRHTAVPAAAARSLCVLRPPAPHRLALQRAFLLRITPFF